MLHYLVSDLGLGCFSMSHKRTLALYGLINPFMLIKTLLFVFQNFLIISKYGFYDNNSSTDPDKMLESVESHLGIHSLQMSHRHTFKWVNP